MKVFDRNGLECVTLKLKLVRTREFGFIVSLKLRPGAGAHNIRYSKAPRRKRMWGKDLPYQKPTTYKLTGMKCCDVGFSNLSVYFD